jgi:hypothetical protein
MVPRLYPSFCLFTHGPLILDSLRANLVSPRASGPADVSASGQPRDALSLQDPCHQINMLWVNFAAVAASSRRTALQASNSTQHEILID